MASVSVTPGGTGPLGTISVVPFPRAGQAVRGFRVDAMSGNTIMASTGFKLGTKALMALPSTSSYQYRAACRDVHGCWSEWSNLSSNAVGNFVPGAIEASIGSGAQQDSDIRSAMIEFPDLSAGSGRMNVRRTLVSESPVWTDEVRVARWASGKSAFHCIFEDLDQWQTELLHRFWRCLGGPLVPFFFDWYDPAAGAQTVASGQRFICRFRDPHIASQIFDVELSSMTVVLISLTEDPEFGDV